MTEPSLTEALKSLLHERSISRGQFVLASGKTSTYYIDARRTTMSAKGQALIGALGHSRIGHEGWAPTAVGGLTMGADPVAYAIAHSSATHPPPVDAFSVRKTAKSHGQKRRVEGLELDGRRVVVVEDVITTGGSALEAIDAVVEAGALVVGVLAVVDRDEGGRQAIEQRGLRVATMVTASELGLVPVS